MRCGPPPGLFRRISYYSASGIHSTTSFLLFTNLWIASSYTLYAISAMVCLQLEPNVLDAYNWCLIFFAVWLVYLLDRLLDPPQEGMSARRVFWKRHMHWQIAGLCTATLGVGWASLHLPLRGILIWIPAGLLSLGYTLPRTPLGLRGLRWVPYLKVFLIASVWSYAGIAYVFTASAQRAALDSVLELGLIRLLWVLAITLPFDMRDVRNDFRQGILTLPLRFGLRMCWKLSGLLALLSMLLTVWWFGHHPQIEVWILSYLLLALALAAWRPWRGESYYAFLLDGSVGIQAALLLWGEAMH